MRAIGELLQELIAVIELKAILRGSFGPREFAVVFKSCGAVCGMRFVLRIEGAETNDVAPNGYSGAISAGVTTHALEVGSATARIPAVLSRVGEAKVAQPIVERVAVLVIDQSRGPVASGEEPPKAMRRIRNAAELDDEIPPGMNAPGFTVDCVGPRSAP